PVTPGSVIGPGQKIMDIIPEKAELIVEARIQPQVIDRINPKQLADIRFSAFSHSPLLMVEGKVESISKDLLTDPDLKQSYYLARISLTQQGRDALGDRELTAGLPAEVMIKTGARSLMSYLTYPLVRRLHKSMKEE
ncbi:MAG: HlyD family efflux transporter periplasmic adaptor subunit, partial [Limnohabitans sp.]